MILFNNSIIFNKLFISTKLKNNSTKNSLMSSEGNSLLTRISLSKNQSLGAWILPLTKTSKLQKSNLQGQKQSGTLRNRIAMSSRQVSFWKT